MSVYHSVRLGVDPRPGTQEVGHDERGIGWMERFTDTLESEKGGPSDDVCRPHTTGRSTVGGMVPAGRVVVRETIDGSWTTAGLLVATPVPVPPSVVVPLQSSTPVVDVVTGRERRSLSFASSLVSVS